MTSKPDETEKPSEDANSQRVEERVVRAPKPDPTRYGDWEKNGWEWSYWSAPGWVLPQGG